MFKPRSYLVAFKEDVEINITGKVSKAINSKS